MDEMMQGLAGQGQQQAPQQPGIKEVVMMLMQGASPEELIAQGIPQEVIEAAMQVINEQMSAQAVPQGDVGLAGMATGQMR
jgi:hypothetical protein